MDATLTREQIESLDLWKERRLTLFSISSNFAMTAKREVTTTGLQDGRATGKPRRKRKRYYLALDDDTLIFEGWDIPLVPDTDTDRFRGNACFNFVGDAATVRDYIERHNVNPFFREENKGKVIAIERNGDGEREVLAYPEIPIRHAVIERMKESANNGKEAAPCESTVPSQA